MRPPLGAAARLAEKNGALWYRAPALGMRHDVVHGVTHASLGNFSLQAGEPAGEVLERRWRLLQELGLGSGRVAAPELAHSAKVARVEGGRLPEEACDAVVAAERGIVLAVTVADCVPVFFVDVGRGAFGIAHAGWRGLAGGLVKKTVAALKDAFGVKTAELLVGAGPAIRGPSYEVGPEVAGLFPETFAVPVGDPAEGRAQLDLPSCALAQAAGAGVPCENLVDFALCTASHPGDLFSHRRGERERHWAFIARR